MVVVSISDRKYGYGVPPNLWVHIVYLYIEKRLSLDVSILAQTPHDALYLPLHVLLAAGYGKQFNLDLTLGKVQFRQSNASPEEFLMPALAHGPHSARDRIDLGPRDISVRGHG